MLRGELLAQLGEELRPWLSAEDLAARLAEADAHLREGIESRIELGMHPLDAEREAVAAYGDARRIARTIGHAVHARTIVVRLRWLAGAIAIVVAENVEASLLWQKMPLAFEMTINALCVVAIGLGITSFRARRSAGLPLLATGIGASLLLWVLSGVLWLNLWNYGGTGFFSRTLTPAILSGRMMGAGDREQEKAAVSLALSDSWGNFLSQGRTSFSTGMGLASVAALVDLGGASLGAAWATRRRRRAHVA